MSLTPARWDEIIGDRGHLLQAWAWGELKSRFGWRPLRLQAGEAAAQLLFRRLPLGLSIAYIPKGPLIDWANPKQCRALFSAIQREVKKRRAIFLKVEPDCYTIQNPLGKPTEPNQANSKGPGSSAVSYLKEAGFVPADTIQPRASLVIDIGQDEADILAAMKQKTRYNIRLAERKGVTVRQGQAADVAVFHQLALTTSHRSDFGVHRRDYYQSAFDLFSPDHCALLVAEYEAEPLAALMVFCRGQDAYYFYGASSNRHRNLMPSYLIQWAAIRWAKSRGATRYDLWGIPDTDLATLEAEFQDRHDGLWGVYRFKRGFGGQVIRSIGAFDYVYNPLLYRFYKLRRG